MRAFLSYLGSGEVDPSLLSNIIHNYYSSSRREAAEAEEAERENLAETEKTSFKDRRKYKGKHKNSPMIIKLLQPSK